MIVAIGMLHNVAKGTWHPILFRDAPLPGPTQAVRRLKSAGHHTAGFSTRAEADRYVGETQPSVLYDESATWPWDGEDVPAMVVFFQGGKIVSLAVEVER